MLTALVVVCFLPGALAILALVAQSVWMRTARESYSYDTRAASRDMRGAPVGSWRRSLAGAAVRGSQWPIAIVWMRWARARVVGAMMRARAHVRAWIGVEARIVRVAVRRLVSRARVTRDPWMVAVREACLDELLRREVTWRPE